MAHGPLVNIFPIQIYGDVNLILPFVCFIRGFHRFQQPFSHIAMVSGFGRELNAHF